MHKKRLNRYARKLRHKYRLQRSHALRFGYYTVQRDRESETDWNERFFGSKWYDPRNKGYQYWQQSCLSGRRRYAKFCTNRRIRSRYRILAKKADPDEIVAPRHADYEKEFDYWWTIY